MGSGKRWATTVATTAFSALALAGCGTAGTIQDYDTVTVWPTPDPGGQSLGTLTTLSKVSVMCVSYGRTDANGMGFGDTYKIDFDGGPGYIDAGTSILTDDGVLNPGSLPEC